MPRLIQSSLTVLVLSAMLFFGTMFLILKSTKFGPVVLPPPPPLDASDDPSWRFHNPEIDQWVTQIKDQRDALAVREQQLKDWEARLAAESREIAAVTQAVSRTQEDFDKRVVLFTDQQKDNLKKQIKVVSDMSPDGAAAMMNQWNDDKVVQMLYSLKPDITAGILDAMTKQGGNSARRAAMLAERIKDVLPSPATNNLTANASR